jgi:hypothetical protein
MIGSEIKWRGNLTRNIMQVDPNSVISRLTRKLLTKVFFRVYIAHRTIPMQVLSAFSSTELKIWPTKIAS